MTIINSFLQRRKLREFHHGIYMVFAAYVLSILLLVIGSDTLYNIKSKADGLEMQSDEVSQVAIPNEVQAITDPYGIDDGRQEIYPIEYRYHYRQGYLQKYQQENQSQLAGIALDDTNWLLGFAMSTEEYGRLLNLMNQNEVFAESEEKTISSFSTDTKKFSLTKDEVQMLEQIVEAEATGEDMKGKILVANVIFNRTLDDEFPDTIQKVIFQKVGGDYQFSPIADKRYWKVKVTKETKEAVQRAMDGEDYSEGALYFMARKLAKKSNVKWFDNNLKWLFKHGEHEFYR